MCDERESVKSGQAGCLQAGGARLLLLRQRMNAQIESIRPPAVSTQVSDACRAPHEYEEDERLRRVLNTAGIAVSAEVSHGGRAWRAICFAKPEAESRVAFLAARVCASSTPPLRRGLSIHGGCARTWSPLRDPLQSYLKRPPPLSVTCRRFGDLSPALKPAAPWNRS